MNKKPKIFTWCDTPTVPTGFGIVAKNLLQDVHKEYDLEILGINYHGDSKFDTDKWFIYPAAHLADPLGIKKMQTILSTSKPDIVFLFQDIFHITEAWDKIQESAPQAKKIIYFPVDGGPFNHHWGVCLKEADVVITYTEFAKEEILLTFPELRDKIKIHTLYHGIDTKVYYPLPPVELRNARRKLNWQNKFVIINLNRFQPRKLIPMTLRATALFTKGYKKCKCGNWYVVTRKKCDLNNCGPEDVISKHPGHEQVLTYLHMVPQEQGMGPGPPNSLQSGAWNAGYRNSDLKGPKQNLQINSVDIYRNPFPESVLNKLYNSACVNISSTIGEGFGFSLAESAAVGTISIAPNNSAIPEVLGNIGHIIPNIAHFNINHDNSHIRPLVDVRKMVTALEIEYKKWLDNDKQPVKSQEAIDRVREIFNWDDKRKFIHEIFKKVLE